MSANIYLSLATKTDLLKRLNSLGVIALRGINLF
jgi:hypothetical protein